jgi:hypothetical protein
MVCWRDPKPQPDRVTLRSEAGISVADLLNPAVCIRKLRKPFVALFGAAGCPKARSPFETRFPRRVFGRRVGLDRTFPRRNWSWCNEPRIALLTSVRPSNVAGPIRCTRRGGALNSILPCKERAPDNLLTVLEKRSGKLKITRRNEFNVVRVFMLPAGVLRRRRYKRTRSLQGPKGKAARRAICRSSKRSLIHAGPSCDASNAPGLYRRTSTIKRSYAHDRQPKSTSLP